MTSKEFDYPTITMAEEAVGMARVDIPKGTIIEADLWVYSAIFKGNVKGEIIKKGNKYILQQQL